jgi:hypothetical protein
VAKKSSKLNINGKQVTVETELENGAYTVKDSKGRTLGSGDAASGGNINFSGGDKTAQKELLNLSGSRSRNLNKELQSKVKGPTENENKAIINKNADSTQKLNLRDMGYGDKLDIPGVTSPPAPDADKTPTPPTGSDTETDTDAPKPAPVVKKAPEKQDLDGSTARYPNQTIDSEYDFVQFNIVEYVPGGTKVLQQIISGADNGGRPSGRMKNQNPVGTIILPIPRNLSDLNNVSYGPDEMNALQAGLGSLVQGVIGGGDVGNITDNLKTALVGNASGLKDFIRDKFTQDIIGGGNVLTRTTGAVLNSNMELLFSGPSLRTFSFNYIFTPRDKAESLECKKIIRMFKKAMAARVKGGALFLYTPHVFLIDFKHKGQPHPFLGKIKPTALTSFGVNYNPNNAYTTYGDGGMVAYELSFSFNEMEPIYDTDYENDEGAEGMGF